jgi:tight adherence protein B
MDYRIYILSKKDKKSMVISSIVFTALVSFLFYRSVYGVFCLPLVLWIFYKRKIKHGKEVQSQHLLEEFVNGVRVLNTSIQAGMSMENAWKEVQKELEVMYGENSLFFKEVKEINHSVALNVPIEKLILGFAYRSGLEDIIVFAELFEYGKRSGGNWRRMIQEVVQHIQDKYDAKREIEVMIASKKLEQQVLNVIPLGILLLLQLSSWDYMCVLYHNIAGILCMTICLVGYGAAFLLSEKILKIQV